jgi:hypothetical protein
MEKEHDYPIIHDEVLEEERGEKNIAKTPTN